MSLHILVTADQIANEAVDRPEFLADILHEYAWTVHTEDMEDEGNVLAKLLTERSKALILAMATAIREDQP